MNVRMNGNVLVILREDGTKIRVTPNDEMPNPETPESIDLKITNRCDMMCPMCHEMSAPDGVHADLTNPLLDSIPPMTELAIGGGNPIAHPSLYTFLKRMKDRGVICNITLHWRHFNEHFEYVNKLFLDGLIHGVGVSVNEHVPCEVIDRIQHIPTAVVHMIVGIADEPVLRQFMDRDMNVLFLGFKLFGRGNTYDIAHNNFVSNRTWLSENIRDIFEHFHAVAFDNLAIDQVGLHATLTDMEWQSFYMGSDGVYTMYVDLVKNEFAKSSVSPRKPIESNDIRDLFGAVRSELNYAF